MRNSYNRFLKGLFAAIFFLGITSVANAQKEQPDSVSAVSLGQYGSPEEVSYLATVECVARTRLPD